MTIITIARNNASKQWRKTMWREISMISSFRIIISSRDNSSWLLTENKMHIHRREESFQPVIYLQCGAVITRSIFSLIFTKDTHISPVRARYGVSFLDPASDWHWASIPAIIHAISYYIGPRYNGTRLYYERDSLLLFIVSQPIM